MSNFFSGGSSTSSLYASGGSTNNLIPKSNGAGQLQDSPLIAPDANTVAQVNTTNVQTFQVYGTADTNASPTNYERVSLFYNSGQSRFKLAAEKGGTGTARSWDFAGGGAYGFLDSGNNRGFQISANTITQYNNVATAGQGVVPIRASARSTSQTTAVASVATFTPGADASFEISANVLVTTSTTHTFTVTCAYTDEGNTARVATLSFQLLAGGTPVTAIANAAGAVPYMGIPQQIRAKGGTSVTIATTGTFTTVTYNVEGTIQQVA